MKILDIHTHHEAPQPHGVISIRLFGGESPGSDHKGTLPKTNLTQAYSVGIHPWDTTREITADEWKRLEQTASRPEVVAIGECGIDLTPKGGPLFRQLQIFRHHVEIAERLRKPMVIHDVKAHDVIVGARRDLHPTQNWAIHGFRRKPEVAAMLLRAGCWISFGPDFNPDTLLSIPEDRILAETDDSTASIEEVIAALSVAYGKDMTEIIETNSRNFLSGNKALKKIEQ